MRIRVIRRGHSHKNSDSLRYWFTSYPGHKCVFTARGSEPTIKSGGRDSPGFLGSHHHTSRSQMSIGLPTFANQTPLCVNSASITHPGTLPINTRLELHSKGSNTKTSLPRSNLFFSCNALSISLLAFLGVALDCKQNPFINISHDP